MVARLKLKGIGVGAPPRDYWNLIREVTVPMFGYDYVACTVSWMLGEAPSGFRTGTQPDTLEIEHNRDVRKLEHEMEALRTETVWATFCS